MPLHLNCVCSSASDAGLQPLMALEASTHRASNVGRDCFDQVANLAGGPLGQIDHFFSEPHSLIGHR